MYNSPFKWWVQSVMPVVFDDSLSYYEVLAKLTKYIEGLTGDVQEIEKILETIEGIGDVTEFARFLETIQSEIGNLGNLSTANKSDIVSAINEVAQKANAAYVKPSGGIPESDLSDDVKNKLNQSGDSDVDYIINNKTLKKAPSNNSLAELGIGTYSVPVGGIPWDTLSEDVQNRIESGGGGSGGTKDYTDLINKPQINGTVLHAGNNTLEELGVGTYSKPVGGIPESDLSAEVQEKLNTSGGIADSESAFVATREYNAGDIIYINGVLYRVEEHILPGTTLVPGNNIVVTTIDDELKSTNEAIENIDNKISGLTPFDSWNLVNNDVVIQSYLEWTRVFSDISMIGNGEYLFKASPKVGETYNTCPYRIRVCKNDGTVVHTENVNTEVEYRNEHRFTVTPSDTGSYYVEMSSNNSMTNAFHYTVTIEYTMSQGITELWNQINNVSSVEPRVGALETLVEQQQTDLENLEDIPERVTTLETDVSDLNIALDVTNGGIKVLTDGTKGGYFDSTGTLIAHNAYYYVSLRALNIYEVDVTLTKTLGLPIHIVLDESGNVLEYDNGGSNGENKRFLIPQNASMILLNFYDKTYFNGITVKSNGLRTDKTLLIANEPADAKSTGEKIDALTGGVIKDIQATFTGNKIYFVYNGVLVEGSRADTEATVINAKEGHYYIVYTGVSYNEAYYGIIFTDDSGTILGQYGQEIGPKSVAKIFGCTAPQGTAKAYINNMSASVEPFIKESLNEKTIEELFDTFLNDSALVQYLEYGSHAVDTPNEEIGIYRGYIQATGMIRTTSYDVFRLHKYAVESGKTYKIIGKDVNIYYDEYAIAAFSTSDFDGSADISANVIIPAGHGATDTDYNVTFTAPNNGYVYISQYTTALNTCYLYESVVSSALIDRLTNTNQKTVKIQIFGDSMSDDIWRTTWNNFITTFIPQREWNIVNSSVGGSGIGHGKSVLPGGRYQDLEYNYVYDLITNQDVFETDNDIIVMFVGTNNFAYPGIGHLGAWGDDTSATFYGAAKLICEYISEHTDALFIVCTPLPRYNQQDSERQVDTEGVPVNEDNKTLRDYCDALVETCNFYHIPIIDLNYNIGWNKYNVSNFTSDGLHPNTRGAKIVGAYITSIIKQHLGI